MTDRSQSPAQPQAADQHPHGYVNDQGCRSDLLEAHRIEAGTGIGSKDRTGEDDRDRDGHSADSAGPDAGRHGTRPGGRSAGSSQSI